MKDPMVFHHVYARATHEMTAIAMILGERVTMLGSPGRRASLGRTEPTMCKGIYSARLLLSVLESESHTDEQSHACVRIFLDHTLAVKFANL